MCGIGGVLRLKGVQPVEMTAMSRAMKHRGPDDEGYYLASQKDEIYCRGDDTVSALRSLKHIRQLKKTYHIGLLHRRLSVIDISPAGHQPMEMDERFVLVYNGEIYNYMELKDSLWVHTERFFSCTDTEVLLKAICCKGKNIVSRFAGMWAFGIYDKQMKKLLLCRDRFGIKPLYYTASEGFFAFSSEIKPLLRLKECTTTADMQACLEYISFGAQTHPDNTLFGNIKEVPPGSFLEVDCTNGTYHTESYYNLLTHAGNISLPAEPAGQTALFHQRFSESVKLHMRTDVPLGSCLSGGLDSSAIVSCAAKLSLRLDTFTASYPGTGVDESHYARLVAEQYDNVNDHYTSPSADAYWKQIDTVTLHQELPLNSTSPFAQWKVMQLASEKGIKVLLDGQGADEILGGYYPFAGIYLIDLFRKWKFINCFNEYRKLKRNFTPRMASALGRASFYFLPAFLQRKARYEKRLGMQVIREDYRNALKNISIPARGGRSFTEFSVHGMQFGMRQLLRYEDRNAMAFSIESRVPFLDHRIVETALALPMTLKMQKGWSKYILRIMMADELPQAVVWRKDKLGFVTPQSHWKDILNQKVKQYFSEAPIPPLLNRAYLVKLCDKNLKTPTDQSEFWRFFSFVKWADLMQVEFQG